MAGTGWDTPTVDLVLIAKMNGFFKGSYNVVVKIAEFSGEIPACSAKLCLVCDVM